MHQKFLQTKAQLQTTVRQLQMVDVEKKKAAQSSHNAVSPRINVAATPQ